MSPMNCQLNGTFYFQKKCTPYSRKGFNDLIDFLVLPYPTKYYAPLGLIERDIGKTF